MAISRKGFSSRLGFVAAAAGSAVGLGNIWKFPYETAQNGGGAFLLLYLICVVLIGFPVMMGEISLGRATQTNPVGAYRKAAGPKWSWVGLIGVIGGMMILSFYNVVAGWAFGYFIEISFGSLLSEPDHGAFFGAYVANITDNLIFSMVFMVLTAVVVLRGIQGGIESASKLLMPLLFLILIGLIIYALTLPNAMAGISYYLLPDFSKIQLSTINSAMGQAFFSLSLGMGALITYGSYIPKDDNVTASASIVTLADTAVAFLAGLLMLPLVFSSGEPPEASGPGLVFTILPGIFHAMGPLVGRIVGGAFFLLLSVAALTSTISLLEVPVSYLVDDRKVGRKPAVIGIASIIFIIGLPSMLSFGAVDWLSDITYGGASHSFLDLINDVFSEVGLPLGGLIMSLLIVHRWGTNRMREELTNGNPAYPGSRVERFVRFTLTYISPVLLGFIFISNLMEKFFGISVF
ncbi:MAG: sodium-dependent transporter [Bacteroidetes bacterium]|nr:MAG: sodium-dependent transporter [Bacteroidota bacterium]